MPLSKPFILTIGCKIWPEKQKQYVKLMQQIASLSKKSKYLSSFQLWNNLEDPEVYIERYEYKSRQHYNRFKKDKKELKKFMPLVEELKKIISQKDIQQNLWHKLF
ncbi:MAG: hypothetical protein A2142_08430 [candidate division Zixibacteria bacterium RBG_16_48_11]|nr:MAG: hypothetical protein A2142_08430 [candidate division Zixibacteria bacterium RBG_16_48_11]